VTKGFAAITEAKSFGELLKAIDDYQGQPTTMAALKLAPLVFVRPIELRAAEWKEFDLDAARWSIPDRRMKEGRAHVVPLSEQALEIIRDLQSISGSSKYLFPSLRSSKRPISDNTLNAALRRLGYSKDEMTAHGFRKSASTLLHELDYSPDEIETQLAHKRPGVAGIYNKSHLLKQRTKMMQEWADHLDKLKSGKNGKK
jgi:integrase